MKSLSILIPIYNEEESLQALFDELKSSFENSQSVEIIFINDGSSDICLLYTSDAADDW